MAEQHGLYQREQDQQHAAAQEQAAELEDGEAAAEEYDWPFYYSSIYNSGLGKPLNSDAVTVV